MLLTDYLIQFTTTNFLHWNFVGIKANSSTIFFDNLAIDFIHYTFVGTFETHFKLIAYSVLIIDIVIQKIIIPIIFFSKIYYKFCFTKLLQHEYLYFGRII